MNELSASIADKISESSEHDEIYDLEEAKDKQEHSNAVTNDIEDKVILMGQSMKNFQIKLNEKLLEANVISNEFAEINFDESPSIIDENISQLYELIDKDLFGDLIR